MTISQADADALIPKLIAAVNSMVPVEEPPPPPPPPPAPAGELVATPTAHALRFTVGQGFAKGKVPQGKTVRADTPIQIDQPTTHPDGSLAFAIISGVLPAGVALPAPVALRVADPATQPTLTPILGESITVTYDIWQFQRSEATFGRYLDPTSIGAVAGDVHTLTLDGVPFALTTTPAMAGTTIQAMTAHGVALANAINADPAWLATSKYHRVTVQRRDTTDERPFTIVAHSTNGTLPTSVKQILAPEPRMRWTAYSVEASLDSNWLDGPICQERWSRASFRNAAGAVHPHLVARFAERQFGSTTENYSIIIENCTTFVAGVEALHCDIEAEIGDAVVLSAKNRLHSHHALWYRDFGPSTLAHPDWEELAAAHVVHRYRAMQMTEESLDLMQSRLADDDDQVCGVSLVRTSMGDAGDRPDIGQQPLWHTAVIVSKGDPRAWASMIATCEASGSVEWHYSDERKGGRFVSIDDYPTIAVRNAPDADLPADKDSKAIYDASPWSEDFTHMPLLPYLPYVLTGRRQYLEELHHIANWCLIGQSPSYREGAKGIFLGGETRQTAWCLRTVGHAAFITPDAHWSKPYFNAKLANNYQAVRDRYINNRAFAAEPVKGLQNYGNLIQPWQEDFRIPVLYQQMQRGVPGAEEFLRWSACFAAARFNRQDQGFCRAPGAVSYELIPYRPGTAQYIGSWKELYDNSVETRGKPCQEWTTGSYPHLAIGYVAIAHSSLELMAALDIEDAKIGLAWMKSHPTAAQMYEAMRSDPRWAIVP